MSEVSGVVHRLQDRISPGYGFTAIIIAYLARLGPWRVVLASILFGALILAGREIQPSGVPAMIQGIILFCLIAVDVLLRYRIRIGRPAAAAAADMIDLTLILAAGVASGTVLLFAAMGEIFAERAGVLNLGVEGMMLFGAVAGFSVAASTGNPWLGLVVAMLAGGLLSLLHAVMAIHFRAEQVISGLALTFLGTGLARVLGDGLSSVGAVATLPRFSVPLLADVPLIGPILFREQSVLTYVGFLLVPLAVVLDRPHAPGPAPAGGRRTSRRGGRPGHRCGAAALPLRPGRGLLAGLAGATITLAISPGWFGDQTTNGRGWIAIGLVIFAQWSPLRAALGAYLFGAIFRFIIDIQGVPIDPGCPESVPSRVVRRRSSSRCCRMPS